jgi:hypothetical protein
MSWLKLPRFVEFSMRICGPLSNQNEAELTTEDTERTERTESIENTMAGGSPNSPAGDIAAQERPS